MRNEPPGAPGPAPTGPTGTLGRLLRWPLGRGPASRRTLALAAGLGAVALAVYLAIPAEPTPTVWLFEDKPLARGRLTEAFAALSAADISPVVEGGRVGVPRDRLDAALKALTKAGVELPNFDKLRGQMADASFLDSTRDRERKRDQARERMLEAWIGTIRGVAKAEVLVTPLEPRGLARARPARAVVRLEADGPRPISYRAVREILGLLRGTFPYDLPEGAVGLADDRDHSYLIYGDPAPERRAMVHAREEDLAAAVLAELDRAGVAGARVVVRWEAAPPAAAGGDDVAVNRPMELVEDGPAAGKAHVTVQVPRARRADSPARATGPAPSEPTDEAIEALVAAAAPPGELGLVTIERVDAPPAAPSPEPPAHQAPRKVRPWWTPAAVGGGVSFVAALVAAGRLLAQRRPSPRPARARRRERFDREDAGPGPAERVRAFVRRNPDAAAGVLQRWIGQGGDAA